MIRIKLITGPGLKLRVLDEGPDCGRALRRRPSIPLVKLEPCSWRSRPSNSGENPMLLTDFVATNVAP